VSAVISEKIIQKSNLNLFVSNANGKILSHERIVDTCMKVFAAGYAFPAG